MNLTTHLMFLIPNPIITRLREKMTPKVIIKKHHHVEWIVSSIRNIPRIMDAEIVALEERLIEGTTDQARLDAGIAYGTGEAGMKSYDHAKQRAESSIDP